MLLSATMETQLEMATFKYEDSTWNHVDWRILQLGAVSLYWRQDLLDEHIAWLQEHGYDVHSFDAAAWQNEMAALVEIGRNLDFPDYYGRNLDALNECLGDIEIPEDGGVALVFRGFDAFYRTDPRTAWVLLDIIESNSRDFLLFGHRLIALVQSDDWQFRIESVGARSVLWNPMEGTQKDRSVVAARNPAPQV